MPDSLEQYSLWGQVFEIAVKRGVLVALLGSGLGKPADLRLQPWKAMDTGDVYGALAQALGEVDPNLKARTRETARHLFELGMGLGQTVLREYLRRLKSGPENYAIRALWCPFQLPRLKGDFDAETQAALAEFQSAFGLPGPPDPALSLKGFPVRADFLLWLEPEYTSLDRQLLCLEFSLNGLPPTADYTEPDAHLEDLLHYAWHMDSRSVFSSVCAEVSGEGFRLSPRITEYLSAFTGRDKPLYKLCQASSYACTVMRWLKAKGFADRPFNVRALSITQNGFESLAARFTFKASEEDPRVELMRSLGRAYRNAKKTPESDEEALVDQVRFAFNAIRKALPKAMRGPLADMREMPTPGKSVAFDFTEAVEDFFNPMKALAWEDAQAQMDLTEPLEQFFKQDPKAAVTAALAERCPPDGDVPLRDLHAAAVVAGMRASAKGQMTVLGLEGNPGIGKTTAVVSYLKASESGFLFVYVSPRVIINDDVTGNLALDREAKQATGILTVTTNAKLIDAAKAWHDSQAKAGLAPPRRVDSAVVAEGVLGLRHPDSSTLILNQQEKEELEQTHIGSRNRKSAETERQDRMNDMKRPGVLKVLATSTRSLLKENGTVDRVVLTAAIQGYREQGDGKNTVDALDNLFRHAVNTHPGIQERRDFARRIPTIVVMVDELTGDGAGAPFVHSAARWLENQFIRPFQSEPLFRVILIVSDASLGNEVVLDRYLNSGTRAPDKALVSPSVGKRPFRLAATPVRIGGVSRPVLHIMTNSYPASRLEIDYRIRLDVVVPGELSDGRTQSVRQAIAEQQGEASLGNVVKEIERAIASSADQVIFFAQDKAFLRDIETLLVSAEDRPPLLQRSQVAILDSSVPATQRKALIADGRRDTVKVFLMTSSGARGVSFPKTDWIIALMPRFGIEAALMEVAQLAYRGRGKHYMADDGSPRDDGDWKSRRLVMLLQDFLPQDAKPDPRQWLRQASDLLTFLVMLRATLHTRITGDAGLDKQKLAMVPVGGIGTEEMLSLMSTHIRAFLQECGVFLHDSATDQDLRGLVSKAKENATHLFSKFSLEATAKDSDLHSMVRIEDIERFSKRASAENAPLLIAPGEDPDALLPAHLYCVGPFWLEQWENLAKQERFSIEGWLTDMGNQASTLYGELKHIYENRDLPYKLRQSAEELYRILARDKDEAPREYSTVKALKSPSVWLAVPLDYARFWKDDANGRKPSLGDEAAWRDSLGRCLVATRHVMPVIPRYADIPYAAIVGKQDPARLDWVFDDRYLAASNELNLLNMLLLED